MLFSRDDEAREDKNRLQRVALSSTQVQRQILFESLEWQPGGGLQAVFHLDFWRNRGLHQKRTRQTLEWRWFHAWRGQTRETQSKEQIVTGEGHGDRESH